MEENIIEITIRKALPEDAYNYTVCHISCFQSAYKGIVPDEYLENMLAEKEQRFDKYKPKRNEGKRIGAKLPGFTQS